MPNDHTTSLFAILLLMVGCCTSLISADPLTPGPHLRIPTLDNPDWTYDLYLPKCYDGVTALPALYLSSPTGNPGMRGLESWAEQRGVVLIAINDPANGIDTPTLEQMYAASWSAIEASVRVHPCLRYAVGDSGAAWMSVILVQKHPDQFAGVQLNISSGNGEYAPPHCAVGFYAGLDDATHPIAAVRLAITTYQIRGNRLRIDLHPGGHVAPSKDAVIPFLDWLLLSTCARHPRLTPVDRRAGELRILAALKDDASLTNPADRASLHQAMLANAVAAKTKPEPQMLSDWIASIRVACAGDGDAIAKHRLLQSATEEPFYAQLPAADKATVIQRLMELRAEPDVQAEWAARQALQPIQAKDKLNPRTQKALVDVINGYVAVVKRWPNTEAAAFATERVEALGPALRATIK